MQARIEHGRGSGWASVWEALWGLLFPEWCQVCFGARAWPENGYVCHRCAGRVQPVEPPLCERCGAPFFGNITLPFECGACQGMRLAFTKARAAVRARGLVRLVIHRYKYERAMWFEPFLAGLLIERAAPEVTLGGWEVIVPVPLHPLREQERQFNQAERLARWLSRATSLPLAPRAVQRVRPTQTQTRLGRDERLANMRGAFAPGREADAVAGRRVVLVDDVLTTGATTSACARVLRRAGAREVCVWTVARAVLSSADDDWYGDQQF